MDEWKQRRRAYMREWRKKNPDKIRKNNEEYWKRRLAREQKEDGKNG